MNISIKTIEALKNNTCNISELENVNRKLSNLCKWFQKNHLIINHDKSKVLQFSMTNICRAESVLDIKLNDNTVERVNHTQFLGLNIDEHLNWEIHVNDTAKKLASTCYVLRRIKPLTDLHVLKQYYFGSFQSIITYGLLCWGTSKGLDRIFKLQKRAIRIIAGASSRAHCKPLFKQNKILTLPSLFIYQAIIYITSCTDSIPKQADVHSHNTRHKDLFRTPAHSRTFFEKNPKYMAIKLYNKLPQSLKCIKNLVRLKLELKTYLLNNSFYSVSEYINSV